jgi:hypothetical protein
MTTLELTDAQRQVLQTQAGRPIDVVDPATQQRYVLLAWEQYEQMCTLLNGGTAQAAPMSPSPAAANAPGVGPLRQRIRDLPLPPEVAAEAKRYCKRLGFWVGGKSLREMEEQMKLQYYYGGLWVACLRTREGPVVVAATEILSDPRFDQQLSYLAPDERRSARLELISRLFDEGSEILTPFPDES